MNSKQIEQALKFSKQLDVVYERGDDYGDEDTWDFFPSAAYTIRQLVEHIKTLEEKIKVKEEF